MACGCYDVAPAPIPTLAYILLAPYNFTRCLFRRSKAFPHEYADLINEATGKWPNWYPARIVSCQHSHLLVSRYREHAKPSHLIPGTSRATAHAHDYSDYTRAERGQRQIRVTGWPAFRRASMNSVNASPSLATPKYESSFSSGNNSMASSPSSDRRQRESSGGAHVHRIPPPARSVAGL
ncbi:hypothetical protein BC826DRAFT_1060487, partial [Russula brevipes]